MNFEEEILKAGLDEDSYMSCIHDIRDKVLGIKDIEWEEIRMKYNLPITADSLRKASSAKPFGSVFVTEYLKNKNQSVLEKDELDKKLEELRKEKIKIQTLNIERNRLDKTAARQELFFEHIGDMCKALPLPTFEPLVGSTGSERADIEYVLTMGDAHYGSTFKSLRNEYSRDIFKERLSYLGDRMVDFVKDKKIDSISIVSLGDDLQGILRLSDLNVNDTTVVKCVVEYSRLIASFLNELSRFVKIKYYHTCYANHTQLRVLNAKASELAWEDLEYVIGNYIKDLCICNDRIDVILGNENEQFIRVDIQGFNAIAMHGHQIKNLETAISDLSRVLNEEIDYLFLGHLHNGKELPVGEGTCHDCEVLVSPSMCGSDPFSDKIMKGSKAAVKIYGFDLVDGHVETYKIKLN